MSGLTGPHGLFPGSIPNRLIRKTERYYMPDGTVREKRWVQTTFVALDGTIETAEYTEVVPPLTDGIVPDDMTDALFCRLCGGLVCRSLHSFRCGACGLTYCMRCRVMVEGIALCRPCAKELTTPQLILKLRKIVWGE